ncbi:MAG: nucleotide exchange factor GrpE, partial [Candidatus Omnitrophica bacterium]|nr:nucleotide exchange factor GrpE [Candidatus Omnitrophota bacterium]
AVPFNPDLHKIKHLVDCDSQESHDFILEVLSVGYKFKELILRPAEVVVMRKQNPVAKED